MKKFLAVAVLGLVVFAGVADSAAIRYKSGGLLKWRTHAAATVGTEGPNYGTDAAGGWVDSSYFYVPNAADGKDTSAVWAFPNDFCLASASDSLPILLVAHKSAAGASGDTLYLGVQPFLGGDQSTSSNFLATAAFPTVVNGVMPGASVAGAVRLFRSGSGGAFAGSETAALTMPLSTFFVPGLDTFRGFRVITYGDGTAAMTGGGQVSVEVLYPTCQ